jgi:hypothetical protein
VKSTIIDGTGTINTPDTPPRILAELEAIVDRAKATWIEVSCALIGICERKLYKPRKWTVYLKERFGFTRQRAHQLMQAKRFIDAEPETSTAVDKIPPESQIRRRIRAANPKPAPATKLVFDLEEEYRTFVDLVTKWEQALSHEDYHQLLDRAEKYLDDILSKMEMEAAA